MEECPRERGQQVQRPCSGSQRPVSMEWAEPEQEWWQMRSEGSRWVMQGLQVKKKFLQWNRELLEGSEQSGGIT